MGKPVFNQAAFGRRVWRVSNTQEGGRGWAPRRPLAEKTCGLLDWPSQNWMNIGFTGNNGFTQLTVMSLDFWYIYIYIVGQNHGFLKKKTSNQSSQTTRRSLQGTWKLDHLGGNYESLLQDVTNRLRVLTSPKGLLNPTVMLRGFQALFEFGVPEPYWANGIPGLKTVVINLVSR